MNTRGASDQRGFPPGTGRTIQIVIDGDDHLAHFAAGDFPGVTPTIDVAHVVEKPWDAGASLHREGTDEHHAPGRAAEAPALLRQGAPDRRRVGPAPGADPLTGPGNMYRRKKLTEVRDYIDKRQACMNYAELRRQDLEIGSGQVEGAIQALMYRRMDHGGIRWIKECAEALLQLRCIDANGDWQAFMDQVHKKARDQSTNTGKPVRLQQAQPAPLPDVAPAVAA